MSSRAPSADSGSPTTAPGRSNSGARAAQAAQAAQAVQAAHAPQAAQEAP